MLTLLTVLTLLGAAQAAPLPVAGLTPAGQLVALPPLPAGRLPVVEPPGAVGVWNGTLTGNKHRAVVALAFADDEGNVYSGGTFCSGTLIDTEWVLTAAHCLDDIEAYVEEGAYPVIGFGAGVPYDRVAFWDGYVAHPSYDPRDGAGAGHDIGLVQLVSPVSEPVMPVNVGTVNVGWVGLELTGVGYGITNDGRDDAGRKRSTVAPLIRFDGDLVYAFNGSTVYDRDSGMYYESEVDGTSNLCQGDSGGATLAKDADDNDVLVAVSVVVTPQCERGGMGSTRTDLYKNWINGYVDFQDVETPGGSTGDDTEPDYTVGKSPKGALELPQRAAPIVPSEGGGYASKLRCATTPDAGGAVLAVAAALMLRRRRA